LKNGDREMSHKVKTKVDELKEALKKQKDVENATASKQDEDDDLGLQIKAKKHYDKLLRVMAEFENTKKRMAKEREDLVKYGNEKLLADLLPSLDDLDRVLDHVPPDASEDVKNFASGVELVRKTLLMTLAKYDLREVDACGQEFDPSRHEAIAVCESQGHDSNMIIAVHRKGYWLGDRLLRPSMVTVSKGDQ
jgi:molecular chaperone GrpE